MPTPDQLRAARALVKWIARDDLADKAEVAAVSAPKMQSREEQSMTVLKVDFVGIRSDRLDETVALFRDVLGVSVNRQTDDLVAFKLADGTVLELYGPANEFHSFFTTGPVVAFRVDNFDVARRAMLAAGIKFIGDVQHAADGVSWQHFYCPDGTVLEISGTGQGAKPSTSRSGDE